MEYLGIILYYGVMFAVVLGAVAMTFNQGIWTNTLTLINVIASGLVAFGYFLPLTEWLKQQVGDEYSFVLPLPVIWLLFSVTFIVLQRVIGQLLSATNMRFIPQLDTAGSWVLALAIALVLTSFTYATLHVAPLPVELMSGKLNYKYADATAQQPDLFWLKLAETALVPEVWGGAKFEPAGYIDAFHNNRAALETKKDLLSK